MSNINNPVEDFEDVYPILDEDLDLHIPITARDVNRDNDTFIAEAQYNGFDNEDGAW